MDYSALIGIHDVELAAPSSDQDEIQALPAGAIPGGFPASASPTALEMAAGVTSNVGCGHRGSVGEMVASAGDGLGEIFEEKLFGPSTTNHHGYTPQPPTGPGSGFPMGGSYPVSIGGGSALSSAVGGGPGNDTFLDFSPPNSEGFDVMTGGGSAEEGTPSIEHF